MTPLIALKCAGTAFAVALIADFVSQKCPEGSAPRFVLERFVARPNGLIALGFFMFAMWLWLNN